MDMIWPIMHRASMSAHMKDIVERRDTTLRQTLEAVDLVICPSNYLMQMFAKYGFDTSNFRFMRQGLQKPTRKVSHVQHDDGVLRLGYVGQIKPHKGVDLLVDALLPLIAAGEPVEVDIWGSETENPAYVETLKSRSAGAPNQIRWRGPYRGDAVWDVMAAMDVLTVPSRWYENSPNAILEAYEMGVPVIAADRGGMAELVIHEKSGLLFKLDNVEDLRRQIASLLKYPTLLEKLRSGIPPVKSIGDEIESIVDQYDMLLSKAANQP
jgi:glycosyltransferase involved in cell wall biosynthesis